LINIIQLPVDFWHILLLRDGSLFYDVRLCMHVMLNHTYYYNGDHLHELFSFSGSLPLYLHLQVYQVFVLVNKI